MRFCFLKFVSSLFVLATSSAVVRDDVAPDTRVVPISFTVTTSAGQPVENLILARWDDAAQPWTAGATDSNGHLTLQASGLALGPQELIFKTADPKGNVLTRDGGNALHWRLELPSIFKVTVPSSATAQAVPLQIALGRIITGRVRLSSVPAGFQSTWEDFMFAMSQARVCSSNPGALNEAYLRGDCLIDAENFVLTYQPRTQTVIFVGQGNKLVPITVPPSDLDSDIGMVEVTIEESSRFVGGRLVLSAETYQRYLLQNLVGQVTFIRFSDRALFVRTIVTSESGHLGHVPSSQLLDASANQCVRLPPGKYLMVPGAWTSWDFQLAAFRKVESGVILETSTTFPIVDLLNNQSADLGEVNVGTIIDAFLAEGVSP